jgi:hypothetical protein
VSQAAVAGRRHAVRTNGLLARIGHRLHDNGLSIVLGLLFASFLAAQALVGVHVFNEERAEHGEPPVTLTRYLSSSHFAEATFENWESEFLQMAAYVLLTVFLVQRGSAESNDPGGESKRRRAGQSAPWPVRRGGWVRVVYENSLSAALLLLFLASFVLHGVSGALLHSADQRAHGLTSVSIGEYFLSAQFWFESFQNWQSEFLAIGSMVVLTIFLRQKGSPESKEVEAPHSETGA